MQTEPVQDKSKLFVRNQIDKNEWGRQVREYIQVSWLSCKNVGIFTPVKVKKYDNDSTERHSVR